MEKAGVPLGLVRTREEWLAIPDLLKSGIFTKLGNTAPLIVPGRLGDVSGPGNTLINDYQEANFVKFKEAADLLGLGSQERKCNKQAPLRKGNLLKGLKVLDLSNIVAGPTSSYTLAQYGAQVIRSEEPSKHRSHPIMPLFIMETLQGKRSILADVKTAPGREIFRRLVLWADVIVHNSLDDTAERLGITSAQLKEINPDVVTCQLSAFGGSYSGGWEKRPGFDPILQATSGLMATHGTLDMPHWHETTAFCDILGGLALGFSALLGVYQKRTTGFAGEVRTSLARVISYAQFPYMTAASNREEAPICKDVCGHFAVGENYHQRIYQCSDGWIYVGASRNSTNLFVDTVANGSDISSLEEVFTKYKCRYWIDKLISVDIGCHQVSTDKDICDVVPLEVSNCEGDEFATGSIDILRWINHPSGMAISLLAPTWVRIGENHSYKRLFTTPKYGEHTKIILAELNYSEDEIEELIRIKVAHEYLPPMGSKESYFFKPNNN